MKLDEDASVVPDAITEAVIMAHFLSLEENSKYSNVKTNLMAVIAEMCHHPTIFLTSNHSALHSVKFQHKATLYSDRKSVT